MYGKEGSKGKWRRPPGRSEAGKPQPAWRIVASIAEWRSRRFRRKRSGKRLPGRRRGVPAHEGESARAAGTDFPGSAASLSGAGGASANRRSREDDQVNLRLARRPTGSPFQERTRMIASLANRQATDGGAGAGMERARHPCGDCRHAHRASAKPPRSEMYAPNKSRKSTNFRNCPARHGTHFLARRNCPCPQVGAKWAAYS